MGQLVIPFSLSGQHVFEERSVLASTVKIANRDWKIRQFLGVIHASTIVADETNAREALTEFASHCLWRCLYRDPAWRIHSNINGIDLDIQITPIGGFNVIGPTFTPVESAKPVGGSVSVSGNIKFTGQQDKNYRSPLANSTGNHSAVVRIFQSACFASDSVSAYILYYAALEILCKTEFPRDKKRVELFIRSSPHVEINTLPESLISKVVITRNAIAHEGYAVTSSDMVIVRELTRRILQLNFYGTSDAREIELLISAVFPPQSG